MNKVILSTLITLALLGCSDENNVFPNTSSETVPEAAVNISKQSTTTNETSTQTETPVVSAMASIEPSMQTMPVQTMPMQTMPMQTMPMQTMPMQTMPMQTMPMQTMPVPVISVVVSEPGTAPVVKQPILSTGPIKFGITRQDLDAARLASQATFGANDAVITEIKALGNRNWILSQYAAPRSVYSRINAIELDQNKSGDYCYDVHISGGDVQWCIGMWSQLRPNILDFFKQASLGPDQLRQRVAFALSQIYVVSAVELQGTYRHARYQQMLRDRAFSNFRDLLKDVTLSPAMGSYLNMVNNNKADPNENFARELLQLFSIGTCALNLDGTMVGGECRPTYDNDTVRAYAFALTGWTYPDGGRSGASCNAPWCRWANKPFFVGSMKPISAEHDQQARQLLSGIVVPSGRTPQQAVELVLDSIMAHPNVAPFISVRLIRALVTSNPSPAYVARVAAAFNAGKYDGIGAGKKGDLQATIAAILLDAEARNLDFATQPNFGKLREPIHQTIAMFRAVNGYTDGNYYNSWGAGALEQMPFHSPSVFNFYYLDYSLPGTTGLLAPEFGITYVNTVIARSRIAEWISFDWANIPPNTGWMPLTDNIGSKSDFSSFSEVAKDPVLLVEHLSLLMTNGSMTASAKAAVVNAIRNLNVWDRAKMAGFYIAHSPDAQIQR